MKRFAFVFIAVFTALMLTGCPGVGPETEPEPATYTVIYNGNESTGGTVPTDSNVYEEGATVTVLDNTGSLVKTGDTFSGWNTEPDVTGVDRTAGTTFNMGGANVTLYAKWVADYAVGDTGPAGGLIFYDKGSYSGSPSWRYLEAAPSGPGGMGGWSNVIDKEVGTTNTAIGTGLANTDAIIYQIGCTSGAAKACYDLTEGGYDDWFLPSLDELELMYQNLYLQGWGGFGTNYLYWSSSEVDRFNAWSKQFDDNGNLSNCDKFGSFGTVARAVRAF